MCLVHMKWVVHALTLIHMIPVVIRLSVLWALIAVVFSKFHSNRWRSALLTLMFLGVTWTSSAQGDWIPTIITSGLLGSVGAITDAYYISTFENTWTYASPRILGIPLWLLPLWWLVVYAILEAAPVVDRLAKEARTLIRPSWVGGDAVHKMLLL